MWELKLCAAYLDRFAHVHFKRLQLIPVSKVAGLQGNQG